MGQIISEGITFDDVLLVPQYSEVLPREVNLKTNLTKKIKLAIPLMSAGMDTVTEYQTATSLAKAGGIGIIHKNMSIKEQASQVKKVKKQITRLALFFNVMSIHFPLVNISISIQCQGLR